MIDPSAKIHPTAIIEGDVSIGANVEVGPWTLISGHVEIGEDTVIGPNVVIRGHTRIGKGNKIFQFASVGEDCQDLKYAGEETWLEIGDNNKIRESVTIHRGTVQDKGITKIGSNCLFMINAHIAHDCVIGDNVILANNATLAGHVTLGDHVIFGGHAAIHQCGMVGSHAFIAGASGIVKDIPPYVTAAGHYAKPHGINSEGLKRRGFSPEQVRSIKNAYRTLYRKGHTIEEALADFNGQVAEHPELQLLIDFLSVNERGIIR